MANRFTKFRLYPGRELAELTFQITTIDGGSLEEVVVVPLEEVRREDGTYMTRDQIIRHAWQKMKPRLSQVRMAAQVRQYQGREVDDEGTVMPGVAR